MKKTITKADYYALTGLLLLASRHNNALDDIHKAAREITGEDENGHTSDGIYSGYEVIGMGTAHEVLARQRHVIGVLDAFAASVGISMQNEINRMMAAPTRYVCAQRARTLRRRGETVWYTGRTSTGKARYGWQPTVWRVLTGM